MKQAAAMFGRFVSSINTKSREEKEELPPDVVIRLAKVIASASDSTILAISSAKKTAVNDRRDRELGELESITLSVADATKAAVRAVEGHLFGFRIFHVSIEPADVNQTLEYGSWLLSALGAMA
jgi:hypothetical protein